jgi:hypothetical protein
MRPIDIISFHEGGHILGRLSFGDAIASATISADSGLTRPISLTPNTHHKLAICALAGPASEYRATRRVDQHCCKTDLQRAARHARDAGIPVQTLWTMALQLVDRYSREIDTVADALRARGQLDGAQIDRVLGRGCWRPFRWN